MICRQCGREFEPKVKWQQSCSNLCSSRWQHTHRSGQSYICRYCGKQFIPKVQDRVTYCSRECSFAHKVDRKKALAEARAILKQNKPKLTRTCPVCGKQYEVGKGIGGHCSRECNLEHTRQRSLECAKANYKPRQFTCKECGKLTVTQYGNKADTFCSKRCARRWNRRANLTGGTHRKRARYYGCEYRYVNLAKILERDGWRCRICGHKTPKELRGTISLRAPEIDHIIPLSLGGSHTPLNLQCACRQCNLEKANKLNAQPLLI